MGKLSRIKAVVREPKTISEIKNLIKSNPSIARGNADHMEIAQ